MMRFLKIELRLLIVGLTVGLVAFLILMGTLRWWSLGSVPGVPVELVDRYPYIYVRTSDGSMYVCEHLVYTTNCVPRDEMVEGDITSKGSCGDPVPFIGRPPGTVIDSLSFRVCGVHEDYDIHIIALEDGQLWIARRTPWIATYPFVFGGLGGLLGLVLGVLYFIASSLFRHRTYAKEKNDFKHQ